MDSRKFAAVLALPGNKRYQHFIKVVADRQEAWGLYQDGWAMAGTDDGAAVFPLWPEKEYAEACAQQEWAGYEPREIELDHLMEVVLPQLKTEGSLPGVFFTPSSKGVTPAVDELLAALEEELQNY